MSGQSPYHQRYTDEEIRRYVEGGMSPAEMHRLEKDALTDPFLADAIEGIKIMLRSHGQEQWQNDISDLRGRLVREKTNVAFVWWKAAAVILVVLTGITVALIMNNNAVKKTVALSQVQSLQKADTPQISQEAEAQAAMAVHDTVNTEKKKTIVAKETPTNKKTADRPERQNEEESPVPVADRQTQETPPSAGHDMAQVLESATREKARTAPVQKAEEAGAAGYDTTMEVLIVQAPVSADPAGVNRKAIAVRSSKGIEPAGGWRSFDEYLNRNRQLTAADSLVHGVQEISFAIDENGGPYDLRIEKSLSSSLDSESVRLIREGPNWTVKGKKRKLKLRIVF